MITFKCKMCGGDLSFEPGATVAECPYCGTIQTLPKLDDDRRANLYDRANHFRRQNEYDKAMAIYEQILAEDRTDAEAYWSLVLCRYGIEYVEDPASRKRVPTVNRAQYASILADEDYKSALNYADTLQKGVYEAEANDIAEIQKGILDISKKEEPFDVFICYKETDANGRRTPDSVLATDLYHQLTKEGFKVFFSRITLEDKIGTAYEPYIFAALNSAKVMVVLGTKPEYFNAAWVKNEWSRYLALIKSGADKVLVPAYRDMDPYDLPEEFAHLQAQDMGKLGFMQDLIRGIKKLTGREAPKPQTVLQQTVTTPVNNVAPLLERAFIFLEDGDWSSADEYAEKVLDLDPKNGRAYLVKLMAQLKVRREDDLKNQPQPFDSNNNYQKVMRFGNGFLKTQVQTDIDYINNRNEYNRKKQIFDNAAKAFENAKTVEQYEAVIGLLNTISDFEGTQKKLVECREKIEQCQAAERKAQAKAAQKRRIIIFAVAMLTLSIAAGMFFINVIKPNSIYNTAVKALEAGKYDAAADGFISLGSYKDAVTMAKESQYQKGLQLLEAGNFDGAADMFTPITEYKDAATKAKESWYQKSVIMLEQEQSLEALSLLRKVGSEYRDTANLLNQLEYKMAGNARRISARLFNTVGLKEDGTVVAIGFNWYRQCDTKDWTEIMAVAAGYYHTVGLKEDGTVVVAGWNIKGEGDIGEWIDIAAIAAGEYFTVGLRDDGTVVAVGNNKDSQCDTDDWTGIVAIAAGKNHTVGLKADGTVVTVGSNKYGQCDTGDWTDIVSIAAGEYNTVGLRSDGTVVAVGDNDYGQCDTRDWTDIEAVVIGKNNTIGLKTNGTVVTVGSNQDGKSDTGDWTDIVAIAAGDYHTVGLKADGTVVAVGDNGEGQCNTGDWKL